MATTIADGQGIPVTFRRIDTPVIGASADQRKAIYGNAAKAIVDMALTRRVLVVCRSSIV